MRYQRSFPNVIPHAKAGCSRVTHPSATKLPLSKLSSNSVRLECVMHAASVHPEPGSNSRIIVLKSPLKVVPIASSFFSQLLLLLFEQYSLSEFYEIFFRTILLLSLCTSSISCCSIFNDRFRCPLESLQLYYSITSRFVCQAFFYTFLNFFRPS